MENPQEDTLVPVLARLLELSPEEVQRISSKRGHSKGFLGVSSILSYNFIIVLFFYLKKKFSSGKRKEEEENNICIIFPIKQRIERFKTKKQKKWIV